MAYLVAANSLLEQKLVMAHVYGHADFFKNNVWFSPTDRHMLDRMGDHAIQTGADEGQLWRDQMKELLKVEGTTAIRRAKLVNGFNKGYRGYRRTYRSCTKPAKTAITRFFDEGTQITKVMVKENR